MFIEGFFRSLSVCVCAFGGNLLKYCLCLCVSMCLCVCVDFVSVFEESLFQYKLYSHKNLVLHSFISFSFIHSFIHSLKHFYSILFSFLFFLVVKSSESFSGYGSMINSNGCASLTPIPNRIV